MFLLYSQRINEHFFSVLNDDCLVCLILCLLDIDVSLLNSAMSGGKFIFKVARLLLFLLTL